MRGAVWGQMAGWVQLGVRGRGYSEVIVTALHSR